ACDFMRVPAYLYANSEKEAGQLEPELRAMKRFGAAPKQYQQDFLKIKNYGCVALPRQAKFSMMPYLEGLAKAARRNGADLFEHARVRSIKRELGSFTLLTNEGEFEARRILIATYDPYKNPKPTRFKKGMYASYCFEVEVP